MQYSTPTLARSTDCKSQVFHGMRSPDFPVSLVAWKNFILVMCMRFLNLFSLHWVVVLFSGLQVCKSWMSLSGGFIVHTFYYSADVVLNFLNMSCIIFVCVRLATVCINLTFFETLMLSICIFSFAFWHSLSSFLHSFTSISSVYPNYFHTYCVIVLVPSIFNDYTVISIACAILLMFSMIIVVSFTLSSRASSLLSYDTISTWHK